MSDYFNNSIVGGFTVEKEDPCHLCKGEGECVDVERRIICPTCEGEGEGMTMECYGVPPTEVMVECPDCEGDGYIDLCVNLENCPVCTDGDQPRWPSNIEDYKDD